MTLHTGSHLERATKHMETKIISGDALCMKHMPRIYTFVLYFTCILVRLDNPRKKEPKITTEQLSLAQEVLES